MPDRCVARRVVRGSTRDTIPGQAFGDGEDPTAGEELGENSLNDRCRFGVEG